MKWLDTPEWDNLTGTQKTILSSVLGYDGPLTIYNPTAQQWRDIFRLSDLKMITYTIGDGFVVLNETHPPEPPASGQGQYVLFSRPGESITGILLPPEPSDTSARLLGVSERDIAISELLREKDVEIARLRAKNDDLCNEMVRVAVWTSRRTKAGAPAGPMVRVFAPDCGAALFTGQELPGEAPWQFWHRVVPDNGYVDLPPYYRIENAT